MTPQIFCGVFVWILLMINVPFRKDIIQMSADYKLAHIPSALSMLDYVKTVYQCMDSDKTDDWITVFGKPFGAQAYYAVWQRLFGIKPTVYSEGINWDCAPDLVTFAEETIGNALGYAIGAAMGSPDKKVWCNISDGALQMGQTLEALLFLMQHSHELPNLFVTIDNNHAQVLGGTSNIVSVIPILNMIYRETSLNSHFMNGHCQSDLDENFADFGKKNKLASIYVCNTIKGYGIKDFKENPVKYHYAQINQDQAKKYIAELDEKNEIL